MIDMSNIDNRFTPVTRKNPASQIGLSLLTFGIVVLIFALVAFQIGHEIASNIKVANEIASPTSLPLETQPATAVPPTNPALPPTVPAPPTAELVPPSSNKPGVAATSTPVSTAKPAAPVPTATVKPAAPAPTATAKPAPAQRKPVAPASGSSQPRPTTKPS